MIKLHDYENKDVSEWSPNDYADLYRYGWGINIVPSNGCQLFKGKIVPGTKKPEPWRKWLEEPIPEELHEKWKKEKKFDAGIMRITGNIWFRDDLKDDHLYCSIDRDNSLAEQEFSPNGIEEDAKKHVIEAHLGTSGKSHWEFYVKKTTKLRNKASDTNNPELKDRIEKQELPAFEVKIGNGVMFAAPSKHPDGTRYEILGASIPQFMNGDKIQGKIENIYKKYGMYAGDVPATATGDVPLPELLREGSQIDTGHNRSKGLLRFIDSLYTRTEGLGLSRNFYILNARWFMQHHTEEPYSDEKIDSIVKQAMGWIDDLDAKRKSELNYKLNNGIVTDDFYTEAVELINFIISDLKIPTITHIKNKIALWWKKAKQNAQKEEKEKGDNMPQQYKELLDKTFGYNQLMDMAKNILSQDETYDKLLDTSRGHGKLHNHLYFDDKQYKEVAEFLVSRYRIVRLSIGGDLVYYDGKRYSTNAELFIRQKTENLIKYPKKTTGDNVIHSIQNTVGEKTEEDFRQDSHKIILPNGTYDIKTGIFKEEFDPGNMVMRMLPHDYNDAASIGQTEKILKDILGEKDYKLFIDFVSICLYPDIGIYMMLVLLSVPGTGKKQLSYLLHQLLGEENIEHFAIHDLARDSTSRIKCARALLNIDEDMSDEGLDDIAYLLKWITMDYMSGRSIYSFPEKYKPLSRLMANTNVLPEIAKDEHMDALSERTHTLMLTKKFRYTEKEVTDIVKNTVTPENYSALLTLALKNATKLYKSQKIENRNTPEREKSIWYEYGGNIRKFAETWLVKDKDAKTMSTAVWDVWFDFCVDKNIFSGTRNNFIENLCEILKIHKTKIRDGMDFGYGFNGIRLRSREEVDPMHQTTLGDDKKILKPIITHWACPVCHMDKPKIFEMWGIDNDGHNIKWHMDAKHHVEQYNEFEAVKYNEALNST